MPEIGEHIDSLLKEEMDRKRFIQVSISIFLAAFGISGLISAIASRGGSRSSLSPMKGYGASRFGKP